MAKYSFSGLFDATMYDSAQVMVVTGPYSIFSNMVSDRLRDMCRGKIELGSGINEFFEEFGLGNLSDRDQSSMVPLDLFFEVVKAPALSGKWFCRVDWKEITKKQHNVLERYIKNPSPYGVLVITSSEFQDYISLLRNKVLNNSQVSHLIQLSFPSRKGLKQVIEEILSSKGAHATEGAIQTFILRMSNCYEEYEERLDAIAKAYRGHAITQSEMAEALEGVENYVLDDFIRQLTVPVKNTRMLNSRKINKMLRVMIDELGPIGLVKKLRYKVNDAIQMRLLINSGVVPVRIRYSVDEAKRKIPDDNKLKGMNDYSFKRLAQVASLTSLRDWVFMKLILSTPTTEYREDEYERALFALINRTAFSNDRLENIVGVIDNLELHPEVYQAVMREQAMANQGIVVLPVPDKRPKATSKQSRK